MGGVFEGICEEAYRHLHELWGLAGPRNWSRWEGQDQARRSIEIDVVADLDDGSLLTGEFKWSSKPLDHDVHIHHERDLEDLARSGKGWAERALSRKGVRLYASAGGFSDHFRAKAAEHGRIYLVSLDDLY